MVSPTQLVKLIDSCDFLDAGLREKWREKVGGPGLGKKVGGPGLRPELRALLYKTFLAAQERVKMFYLKVELSRDRSGEYKKLVGGKYGEALRIAARAGRKKVSGVAEGGRQEGPLRPSLIGARSAPGGIVS